MAKKKQPTPAFRQGNKQNIYEVTWKDIKGQCISMLFATSLLCFLIMSSSYNQYKKNLEVEKTITEINLQINKEEKKAEKLKEREKYMQTNAYIEEEAREKLGLVRDDEIIFIEND